MVKRWLSTFAEQPSPATLPVVAEDLDDRMMSQHVVGEERQRALQNGGWVSRTGAFGDRMQLAGFSGNATGAADQADCMDLEGTAAARTAVSQDSAKRRNMVLVSGASFLHAVFTGRCSVACSISP